MPAFRNKLWDGKIRLFSAYDQKLYYGLLPYVESFAKKRNYPYDFNQQEKDPAKKMIAQTPGQYMAYSAKMLQEGLISGNPAYEAMLSAIKTGTYDEYSQKLYDEKSYTNSRKITKGIIQYQRGR